MYRLTFRQSEGVAGYRDRLVAQTDEMHLDASRRFVIERVMAVRGHVEVAAELAVDPGQQVQIESGGDALRVVVCRVQQAPDLS